MICMLAVRFSAASGSAWGQDSHQTELQREAALFFARYRDLTAAGFYSAPVGRKDLGYIGNVPLKSFDGPPPELLRKLNLL